MHEIGQVELFVDDGPIPDGWYLCEGGEPPSGIQKNEEVMEILDRYDGMPDFRPVKTVIYLGGSNDR